MEHRDFSKVPVVWNPKEGFSGVMKRFATIVEQKYNVKIKDYWDLHKWSIEKIPEFWAEMWDFTGIIYSKNYDKVIDANLSVSDHPKWFQGARLNFAENILKFRDNHTALIVTGETRNVEYVTYEGMYEDASLYSAALRKFGLKKGDRVACVMPNRKEAIVAMLGVTSIGGIWTGCLPSMGAQATVNRLKQVEPRILFTIDRFQEDKEEQEMHSKVAEIANGIQSLEKVVIVPSREESSKKDIRHIRNSCFLEDFLASGKNADGSVPHMEFEQVSCDHPVFINYTSGTTGLPKAIIHGTSALLCVARNYWMHLNVSRDQVVLTISPVGWGTWNMFVMMLFTGQTLVLFEGVPYFLSPTYLWDIIDKFGITLIVFSPSIIEELEKKSYIPTEKHNLTSLQTITCGGSFIKESNYEFVHKIIPGAAFAAAYGSTEVLGACALFENTVPAHSGEFATPALGIDIKIYDESGKPVIGKLGEVVITKPTPDLFLGLWGDPDDSLRKNVYYSKFPGSFSMGDVGIINPFTNGIIVYGRNDDTLKPGGYRFGSSEIYNVVENFLEVADSICVSQFGKDGTERAVLFLQLQKGGHLGEELAARIRKSISEELSKYHVPEVILQTQQLPRNLNGKKMEMIVKKVINNQSYNADNILNPECLLNFRDIPELQGF